MCHTARDVLSTIQMKSKASIQKTMFGKHELYVVDVDADVDVVCEGTWNTKESCLIK